MYCCRFSRRTNEKKASLEFWVSGYSIIVISTGHDHYKDCLEPVYWEEVLRIFKLNAGRVVGLLRKVISLIN